MSIIDFNKIADKLEGRSDKIKDKSRVYHTYKHAKDSYKYDAQVPWTTERILKFLQDGSITASFIMLAGGLMKVFWVVIIGFLWFMIYFILSKQLAKKQKGE